MRKRYSNKRIYADKKLNQIEKGKHKYAFRSRSELEYAKGLETLRVEGKIKKWEYEADTFLFTIQTKYTPDWKITGVDGKKFYIETKGFMRQQERRKLREFTRSGTNVIPTYLKFYCKSAGALDGLILLEKYFERKGKKKKCCSSTLKP